MAKLKDDAPEFRLYFVHETDGAMLVSEHSPDADEYETEQVWIPKSQIEIETDGDLIPGDEFYAKVSQWMAEKARLI